MPYLRFIWSHSHLHLNPSFKILKGIKFYAFFCFNHFPPTIMGNSLSSLEIHNRFRTEEYFRLYFLIFIIFCTNVNALMYHILNKTLPEKWKKSEDFTRSVLSWRNRPLNGTHSFINFSKRSNRYQLRQRAAFKERINCFFFICFMIDTWTVWFGCFFFKMPTKERFTLNWIGWPVSCTYCISFEVLTSFNVMLC